MLLTAEHAVYIRAIYRIGNVSAVLTANDRAALQSLSGVAVDTLLDRSTT